MTQSTGTETGEAWQAADVARAAAATARPAVSRPGTDAGQADSDVAAGATSSTAGDGDTGVPSSGANTGSGEEQAPGGPGATRRPISAADIEEALRDVIDPELGINVVDLGLVYGVQLADDGGAIVDMTLTTAACPLTDVIEQQAAAICADLVPSLKINWVWMPPWGPERITDDGREQLRAIGFNV